MAKAIRKAAVIGSGVMGATIAAHLANVGISCFLLDIVPKKLTNNEEAKGLTLTDPAVRNRLAVEAIQKLSQISPSPLFDQQFTTYITAGNIEDHLHLLKDVDWIIEVVIENLQIKQSLLQKIEQVWTEGTIVSTNTSGISINGMAELTSERFQRSFLGTHFFNPPRYMKLLEIIPGKYTDPAIVEQMSEFSERVLGKGVVVAKDTPNFIGNRIGVYGLAVTLKEMLANGYSVDEIDAVTGPALGRPKSATFRTLDLVGIDTFVHVADNVYRNVEDANEKAIFEIPAVLKNMVANGWLGEKSGQGFYKKVRTANGSEILSLDLSTMEYLPKQKIKSASLEAAKAAKGTANKVRALILGKDRQAKIAWDVTKQVLLYAAEKLGEIADTIPDIDKAMRWGFNWSLGPFELWDAIGLKASVEKMEAEDLTVPAWVKAWIEAGHESFYHTDSAENKKNVYIQGSLKEIEDRAEYLSLQALKDKKQIIISNNGANLLDMGDGVAC